MKEKPFRLFSRAALALLMMLLTTTSAWADTKTVSYIDADGTQKSVEATVLTGNETPGSYGTIELVAGWYAVTHDVSYTNPIIGDLYGTVHIILCDGAELSVIVNNTDYTSAFSLNLDSPLSIYGQSAGTGRLTARNDIESKACSGIFAEGGITINGGIVNATASASGIHAASNAITINGGQVTATNTQSGNNYYGIITYGTITLGLRKASDFITSTSYSGTVNIKSGQRLTDGDNIYTGNSVSIPGNKTLRLADFTDNGDGTYSIGSATGWGVFCDALQDNDTYNRFSDKTVKLIDDIEVSRMAGSSGHDFKGTFDGKGNTITLAIGTTDSPVTEEYAAPFRNVENGANIHSLVVDGHIYTNQKYAAGIVGNQYGTVNLQNCHVSTIIHSSKNGDGTHGGIVANQHGTLTIEGCVFDGRFVTTNGTTSCGGLVGYHSAGTCTISNCLYAPTEYSLATGESYITSGATFCRNYSGTPANCYYTQTLGTAQGKLRHSITAGERVSVANAGAATNYSVSGITTNGTGIKYGDVLYAGSGDAVSLSLSNTPPTGCILSAYTASAGTLSGDANPYTLTMPDANVTIGATFIEVGDGTASNPYVIYDWNTFRDWMTNYYDDYKDKYFKLGADVNATTMVCDESHPFCGTFDGNGHTLTISYESSETYCAPFRIVSIATIRNLHVAGTITTSELYAAGIVGKVKDYCSASLTIENCRCSVAITSTKGTKSDTNNAYLGGIVGVNSYGATTTISGCVFDGKLLNPYGYACGGFIGKNALGTNKGTATISNSLFAPSEVTVLAENSQTFCRGTDPTFYNAYYTQKLGDKQGTKGILLFDGGVAATANEGVVSRCNGAQYKVQLQGRTLYKDGKWNTLVLPFAISDFTGTPLEDATVKELLTTSNLDNNGTLTLNFSDALTAIEAGKPYIVKWSKDAGYDANPSNYDLVNPVFTGVTIDNTNRDVDFTDGSGSFKGTYAPLEITDANRSKVLLLSGNNKLGYAKTDRTIANGKALGTCRAYFYFPGSQTARSFVMNFGDDDTQTTGIVHTEITESTEMADAIYDLQGRRIEKPKKGLYIVNGKKVLVH